MKVKIEQLKNVLKILKAGLSGNKETTDQSNSFVFKDGMGFTYNDEFSVRTPIDLGDVEGAVSAKELSALIGKLKGEECEIEFSDNELKIKNGKIRAGIRLESEIHMPLDEISLPDKKAWKLLPSNFSQVLKSVVFSSSTDQSQPILTVIHCAKDVVESTDSERATQWWLDKEYFVTPLMLPAEASKPLIGYGKLERYAEDESWIHVDLGSGSMFSCRKTADGKYPELDKFFDVEGEELSFPTEIGDMLDRAGIFIEVDFDQERMVHLSVSDKGILTVRAEGDSGWIEESMRIKYSGSSIQFQINPQYLQQILSTVNKGLVGEDRIVFEFDSFRHVVALEVVK